MQDADLSPGSRSRRSASARSQDPPFLDPPAAMAEEPPTDLPGAEEELPDAASAAEDSVAAPAAEPELVVDAQEAEEESAQETGAVVAAETDEDAAEGGPAISAEDQPAGLQADSAALAWVRSRVLLPGVKAEMWTSEHDEAVVQFFDTPSQRRLLAFFDPVLGLTVSPVLPREQLGELLYFLKPADTIVTQDNIATVVQYGTVRGAAVASLLRVMSGVFSPLCLADNS